MRGKTNHSMRASGATAMFQNSVPERIIQSVTGHRSVESLRAYERVSTAQHTEVSKIMMNSHSAECSTSSFSRDLSGITISNCSIGQMIVNTVKENSDI